MSLSFRWREAAMWLAVVLSVGYYVALSVFLGIHQMWVPFGLSAGAGFMSFLYLTVTALYVCLDRNMRRRLTRHRQTLLLQYLNSKGTLRDGAAAMEDLYELGEDGDSTHEKLTLDGDEDREARQEALFSDVDGMDDRDEDMLTSITSSHCASVMNSVTLSSIVASQSSLGWRAPVNVASSTARNPLHAPSHDSRRNDTAGGEERTVATRKANEAVVPSSSISVLSAGSEHRAAVPRAGLEGKNTVKDDLRGGGLARGVWQSFASLLSNPDSRSGGTRGESGDAHSSRARRGGGGGSERYSARGGVGEKSRTAAPASPGSAEAMELLLPLLAFEQAESARWVSRFTLEFLPRARIFCTVVLALTLWASCFTIAYYTNVLFAFIPAFACPVLWQSMGHTDVLFHCVRVSHWNRARLLNAYSASMESLPRADAAHNAPCDCRCARVVRVLTHWFVIVTIWVVTFLVYVAAITLPLIRQDELHQDPAKGYTAATDLAGPTLIGRIATTILSVCYLSPIPAIALGYTAMLGEAAMKHTAERICSDAPCAPCVSAPRRCSVACDVARAGALLNHGHGDPSAPMESADGLVQLARRVSVASQNLSTSSYSIEMDTVSTLSSIIRSSLSVTQSLHCRPGPSGSLAFADQAAALAAVHAVRTSVIPQSSPLSPSGAASPQNARPQLKTITLLYIAFRDIFGSDNEPSGAMDNRAQAAASSSSAPAAGKSRPGPGTGAAAKAGSLTTTTARDRNHLLATKFELLLQAVEEARGEGDREARRPTLNVAGAPRGSRKSEKDIRLARGRTTSSGEVCRGDSDAYVLTAHEDAVVLVWGLLPFSSDPVRLAVEKAQSIFACFRRNPKAYALYASGSRSAPVRPELTAAVVYAPHSLVGTVGSVCAGYPAFSFRTVHFFSPDQHTMGSALLERGFELHRELYKANGPTAGTSRGAVRTSVLKGGRDYEASSSVVPLLQKDAQKADGASSYQGILLDSRAAHSAASHILTRPCGVIGEETSSRNTGYSFFDPLGCARVSIAPPSGGSTSGVQRSEVSTSSESNVGPRKFSVLYDFVTFLTEQEEEWHLVVQRNEKLSVHFRFLLEATQNLQQNCVRGAQAALRKGIDEEKRKAQLSGEKPEVVEIASLLLSDISHIETSRRCILELVQQADAPAYDFCI